MKTKHLIKILEQFDPEMEVTMLNTTLDQGEVFLSEDDICDYQDHNGPQLINKEALEVLHKARHKDKEKIYCASCKKLTLPSDDLFFKTYNEDIPHKAAVCEYCDADMKQLNIQNIEDFIIFEEERLEKKKD